MMRCSWLRPASSLVLSLGGWKLRPSNAFAPSSRQARRTVFSTSPAKPSDQDDELAKDAPRPNTVTASPTSSPGLFQAMQDRAANHKLHDEAELKGATNFERILGYPKDLALQPNANWKSQRFRKNFAPFFQLTRAPQMGEWESIETESDLFIPQLGEFDVAKAYEAAVNMNHRLFRLQALQAYSYTKESWLYVTDQSYFPEGCKILQFVEAQFLAFAYTPNTFDVMSDGFSHRESSVLPLPFCKIKGIADDTWYVDKYDLQAQGYFGDVMNAVESSFGFSAIDMHHAVCDILRHQDIDQASVITAYQSAMEENNTDELKDTRTDMVNSNLYDDVIKHIDEWKEADHFCRIHATKLNLIKLYEDEDVDGMTNIPSIHAAADVEPMSINRMIALYEDQLDKCQSDAEPYGFRDYHTDIRALKDTKRIKVIRSVQQYVEAAKSVSTPREWDDYVFRDGYDKGNDKFSIFAVLHEDHPEGKGKPIAMGRIKYSKSCDFSRFFRNNRNESPQWEISPSNFLRTGSSPLDLHFYEYLEVMHSWTETYMRK